MFYGDINAKQYVKDFIGDLLINTYNLDDENILKAINFSNPKSLSIQDKFEILLHIYKKKHGYQALTRLIVDNKLDDPKFIIEDGESESFIIIKDEIEEIYKREVKMGSLNFEDKLNILVQRIYQSYKGFSVIERNS